MPDATIEDVEIKIESEPAAEQPAAETTEEDKPEAAAEEETAKPAEEQAASSEAMVWNITDIYEYMYYCTKLLSKSVPNLELRDLFLIVTFYKSFGISSYLQSKKKSVDMHSQMRPLRYEWCECLHIIFRKVSLVCFQIRLLFVTGGRG